MVCLYLNVELTYCLFFFLIICNWFAELFLHWKLFKRHLGYKWYIWESLFFSSYYLDCLGWQTIWKSDKKNILTNYLFPESRNLRLNSSSGEIKNRNKHKTLELFSQSQSPCLLCDTGAALMVSHFKPFILCWLHNNGWKWWESDSLNLKIDCLFCLRKGINT